MSLRAYQAAAQRAESPREQELRLFGQVTRALTDAAAADASAIGQRADALDWNRRVWGALIGALADPSNQLPQETRASLISLGLFVEKHTSAVIRREDDDIQTLIDINRSIMQGLAGGTAAEAA